MAKRWEREYGYKPSDSELFSAYLAGELNISADEEDAIITLMEDLEKRGLLK
ncbi:hypothetical protein [Prevotella pallens]|uniref:hypothetical protein n=1 Tax=Prevotella pallens TaxID=60133 RepID=UPI001CB23974|nr:hypothetical protein [Prevotella pallens]MBF1463435.1 hypothetical protein [Prevotella pallens]